MRTIKLTLIALATALSHGIAHADETTKIDVIVVTGMKPELVETPKALVVDMKLPSIDFSELKIEAPRLDRSEFVITPARIDIALQEKTKSQS